MLAVANRTLALSTEQPVWTGFCRRSDLGRTHIRKLRAGRGSPGVWRCDAHGHDWDLYWLATKSVGLFHRPHHRHRFRAAAVVRYRQGRYALRSLFVRRQRAGLGVLECSVDELGSTGVRPGQHDFGYRSGVRRYDGSDAMDLAFDQTRLGTRWSLNRGWASFGLQSVSQLGSAAELLAQRRYGCIVTRGGRLEAVHGRWWPYVGNQLQLIWDSHVRTLTRDLRTLTRDRCELYYHQSLAAPGYLTLSYVHAGPATSIATLYAAGLALDEIARIRNAKAIVCHVSNERISHAWLERWGWQTHCPTLAGRHYIKRFYGDYPSPQPKWRNRLGILE